MPMKSVAKIDAVSEITLAGYKHMSEKQGELIAYVLEKCRPHCVHSKGFSFV